MASVSTAPDDAPGDNPPEHELYDPFVDDEAAPSDYNLRSGASKAKTYDRLLRCVARDNRASDESDGLEGDSPVEYNLPSGEKACLEEERLWVAAFFCSTSDWLGRGDNASFVETARIFAETWSPRHLVKPPTADYVKNVLLSAWRERYDGEGAVFDLFEKQKTGGSKLKTMIVRLIKDADIPTYTAHLAANLVNVPLPLTPESLRLHSHLLELTAQVLDGTGTKGSIADSLSTTESEQTSPSEEGNAHEPAFIVPNPFLNQFRYVEAMPDVQKDAVSEEKARFLTNRDLRIAFEYAHILPKRPERSPVAYALKEDILLASGGVPLGFYINHSSNILPFPRDPHTSFDSHFIGILPTSKVLQILLQLVKEDEGARSLEAAKGETIGLGSAFQKLIDDPALAKTVFPLEVNVVILTDQLFVLQEITVLGGQRSTVYRPSADGTYRAEETNIPLPPQIVSRLDPLLRRQPNPFLLVISTAMKVILHPQRPLPVAFRDDILVALEIFVRLFRTAPTYSLQDPANPLLAALAAAAIETSTPKKQRKKAVAKEIFVKAQALPRLPRGC